MLMWMGEQITKRGIGNGISLLIFASILTSAPAGINAWVNGTPVEKLFFPIVALGVVVSVVFVQEGQRRIPIQYAKRMVGRRQTGGQSTYMPLRVNMAGVIPVIFAADAARAAPDARRVPARTRRTSSTRTSRRGSWTYLIVEALLIIVFTFFYTAVTFNPVDQADELRKYGGYIPGIRPGPPTAHLPRPRAHPPDAARARSSSRRWRCSRRSSSTSSTSRRRPRAPSAAPRC